ncbi:MAG: signal recognition particle protein [Acidimicrobiaceae bacterium]|jgi:signal recognition particle subunit SRP54|nr:signal recognition particle protein [Acidimicrobiaceae bacterium]|tara:strand:- start:538 stop:1944 length:1407 start_codon:yes stop_codon:yes gene_type:complete
MFDTLTDRLGSIFGRLRSKGKLSESDINSVMAEVRTALLEADVNLQVAKNFQARVTERSVSSELHNALNPAQQVIKIVNEELIEILGGEAFSLTYSDKPPTVILLAGLQGVGKTTNAVKLAKWFKSQGRNPMLIAADLQRPAAVEQLRTLASGIDVPVYSEVNEPVSVARNGLKEAISTGRDVLICDTAGRLSIDQKLMDEIQNISDEIKPHYTFLVIDAMTGQEAVNIAGAFNEKLSLDGMIITKLDGDSRGGAALSAKTVVGKPIAFASTGEKIEDFEVFHPDRLASRILGMGDVLTLIEKAEDAFDQEEAQRAADRLLTGQFNLEDFLDQMQQLKKMGPLQNIVGMMPDLPQGVNPNDVDETRLTRVEAIITSMTYEERDRPEIIDGSRRNRIAKGSGASIQEVSLLLKQFKEIKRMMKGTVKPNNKRKKKSSKRRKGKQNPRAKSKIVEAEKSFDLSEFGSFKT